LLFVHSPFSFSVHVSSFPPPFSHPRRERAPHPTLRTPSRVSRFRSNPIPTFDPNSTPLAALSTYQSIQSIITSHRIRTFKNRPICSQHCVVYEPIARSHRVPLPHPFFGRISFLSLSSFRLISSPDRCLPCLIAIHLDNAQSTLFIAPLPRSFCDGCCLGSSLLTRSPWSISLTSTQLSQTREPR
jgi:hypothetical protein